MHSICLFQLPTIGLGKRKRRQYDVSLINRAYEDIMSKKYSVYKAARVYGIPESTLRDRTLGIQPIYEDGVPTTGSGPILSREEEKMLIDHLEYMNTIGYGYSRKEFLLLATDFAISRNKKRIDDPIFSQAWFEGLKRRWPAVRLAKPQKLSLVRAKSASKPVIEKYYNDLESVMTEHNLTDKPERIFNIDETGITMEHTPAKIVCSSDTTPQSITSSRGKNMTIIGCGSAAGFRLPPFYVFPGKRWNGELMEGTSPGSAGCMTESGWSNSVVFQNYLETHFKRYVPLNGEKTLILFDGHKSHVNLTLSEWGKQNNVVFFVLPPHTSHITQPLDVGCFGPLKSAYHRECQAFLRNNPGQQITKYDVGGISSKAYNKAITADNLISSFRKTGIFPLRKNIIPEAKLAPSQIYADENEHDEKQENNHNQPQAECSVRQQEQEHESDTSNSFLDSRKIIKIKPKQKQRATPPTVTGNLDKECNQDILSKTASKQVNGKSANFKTPLKNNKKKPPSSQTSAPGTSGMAPLLPDDVNLSDSSPEEMDEQDLCCVCHKFNADGLNPAFVIEFIRWAQCEKCMHWTHLKYCTKVRCLRRDSVFLCPHCDPSTRI